MKCSLIRGLSGLAALTPAAAGASLTTQASPEPSARGPMVELSFGSFTGKSSHGIETFNGIPYAEPPVGPLRLRPPKKLSRHVGHKVVSRRAPVCPQMIMDRKSSAMVAKYAPSVFKLPFWQAAKGQEDCLIVTVQRPAGVSSNQKLPVLIFLHGGGYEIGGAAAYDSTLFLATAMRDKQPFIYVALNYRLGGFGFMPGSEILHAGSANLGLLDQRLALEWVADNIARFGGDPDKVTIWGESAGAYSVLNQMALFDGNASSYNGKPLFRSAIMNSGSLLPALPVDCAKGQAVYDAVVEKAGCEKEHDTLGCLRNLEYSAFLNATAAVPGLFSYNALALSYLPRPDGKVLTASIDELIETGRYYAIPMIISDLEDEGTLFSMLQQPIQSDQDFVSYLSKLYFPHASKDPLQRLVRAYPSNEQGSPFRTGSANVLYPYYKRIAAWMGDYAFQLTRRKFLELATKVNPKVSAWSCLSSTYYGTPDVGTFHTSDLAQLFYDKSATATTLAWRRYYANFVHSINPNQGQWTGHEWPVWSQKRSLLWFKNNSSMDYIQDDFRSEAYNVFSDIWGSLRQ
ncbi:hypothetical protein HIM_11529 [Hirsutella minnesotensis 3608]|uniref:Carboxylic ester hydrolase n=1 Tax=Hirsutella minnesotensis 3608 TaxID=1043627 RepID=A0A0F8A122_9HYPO|nr:hypothetical protein HIM_11529 [Hirsutella minnesotensis 3608]